MEVRPIKEPGAELTDPRDRMVVAAVQRASFDVALFVVLAPKGPDKTAQGNALGARKTAKTEGTSPEGAQQPTGDVSPLQGSIEGFATATPGVARG